MRHKQIKTLVVVLAVFICTLPSLAAAPQGELNFGLGYQWDSMDKGIEHISTQSGFRLVLEDDVQQGGKIHFSTRGWWDWKTQDGKLGVDQLWLSGYAGDVDYTLGRQVISWGTADGFNPTNYFGRLNSNALLSGELGGDPLWAGQATYYGSNWSATGVVIPFFTPQGVDAQMQKMMLAANPQAALLLEAIEGTAKPSGLGTNSEWALRAETQIGGFDVQASFFSGFEPLPGLEMVMTYNPELDMVIPVLEGKYRRQHFVGLATTGTLGAIGVWGEVSYGGPESFEESTNPMLPRIPLSINEKYLQAVIGGDYTFDVGKGLLTQAQYIYRGQGSLFAPYLQPGEAIEGAHYLYGRLGYDFSADSSVELVLLHGLKEKSGLIRPAYTHRLPYSIQLELSLVHTYGDGELGSVPTQGRLALSYKF